MTDNNVALVAHLMRRAGFGATRSELEEYAAEGYDATVDELLRPSDPTQMPNQMIRRYHAEQSGMMGPNSPGAYWLYRMISTKAPLHEKMSLFWHSVFATGYTKLTQGKVMIDQIRMFRRYGMGSFRELLLEVAKDPAMIIWLDNQDNHNGSINENFGRELLELFSMGVGNYTEQDIKECARAFTGWTIANTEYMELRARRDSIWPYGRIAWHFEYREEDHDDGEKTFLGETGRLNGEDVIDIICRQPATAKFISRHLYHFFVADEPPVPQWPYQPPRDPEAIEMLSKVYFDSGYSISAMLEALFMSESFQSQATWFEKVKSPAELVASVLRLTGEFERPRREILETAMHMVYMGQHLINPPSVEGWHQGVEWIDTGTLVERVNFSSKHLGNLDAPGVRAIVERIKSQMGPVITPERLVDGCLDQMGIISVSQESRNVLVQFASEQGDLTVDSPDGNGHTDRRVTDTMQVVAATHEFQRA